jgi:T4 superinfection immunity protein
MYGNTVTVIMLLLIVLIYMLPTLVAFGREHPRRHEITVVNILLGWTLIGWIGVFLWASLVRVEDEPVRP